MTDDAANSPGLHILFSGPVSNERAVVGERILRAEAAVEAAEPLRIMKPDPALDEGRRDLERGVVAWARWMRAPAGWFVLLKIARGRSGLVISDLRIEPEDLDQAPDGSGVTAGLLRRIPTGELLASVRASADFEEAQREGTRAFLGSEPVPGIFQAADGGPTRHGGRAALPDDLLREVALAYLEETGLGRPPRALARLAKRFERPEETLRTWIARARRDGWLGPGTKGRAGAEKGPRLLAEEGETR